MEEARLTDPFIKGWLDYLAFALSGLDAAGTLALPLTLAPSRLTRTRTPTPTQTPPHPGTLGAAVAFTMGDLYRKGALLDYPVGGSGAVIDALVRGIERHGGTWLGLG